MLRWARHCLVHEVLCCPSPRAERDPRRRRGEDREGREGRMVLGVRSDIYADARYTTTTQLGFDVMFVS